MNYTNHLNECNQKITCATVDRILLHSDHNNHSHSMQECPSCSREHKVSRILDTESSDICTPYFCLRKENPWLRSMASPHHCH